LLITLVEDAMLKRKAASLIACALLLSGHPASACATLDGKGEVSPLKTRKPVLGDDVRLVTGFGMRRDPILRTLRMHAGIGWAAPRGTQVVGANGGRVVSASVEEDYGNTVILDHGGGWQTLYAHLDTLVVHEGDCVEALAVIGNIGSNGFAYGPRLYFEVRRNGQPINPFSVPVEGQAQP
jgi:murein DD-endopeptidase MepM/ murein hydrolase activator NlpD